MLRKLEKVLMRFSGKVAIVTGGARGIGFAIAQRLGREGAAIAIADVNSGASAEAVDQLRAAGVKAISIECDVADEDAMDATAQRTEAELGSVDVLIANAGLHLQGYTKPPCALSNDAWRRMLDVNLLGIVNGARSCRPAMARRGGGVIVTISSMAGYKGENGYGISKLAVRGLTVALAKELAPEGIRVCGIAPGLIGSEEVFASFPEERRQRYVNEVQLVRRLGVVEDIAGAAAYLASDEASFVTAETLLVTGGAFCRI